MGGNVKAQYVWSPLDRWTPIRRKRSVGGTLDETKFVLKDYLDPTAIISSAGTVDERFSYGAFGPVRFLDASFVPLSGNTSAFAWTFLFHAEFLDTDSGLYNYGFRFYNPSLGRWLSRDPIGEKGGLNLYGFCYNNALSWYDVLGRDAASDFLDKVDPGRDKTDDGAKRAMMDERGCIGGAAAGCGQSQKGLTEKSECWSTEEAAKAWADAKACPCKKPARVWVLRYKSNENSPVDYDKELGTTFPATGGTQDKPDGTQGTAAAETGQFDSRVINNGRAQGVIPTGPSQDGKIPYKEADETIEEWRKNTQGYDKEQWCVTCPDK